jgi:hypothetical protein
MAEEQGATPGDARLMPSWTPSDPHDEQREPKSSAPTPTPASEVDAARRLLQELFYDTPAEDGDDSIRTSRP